MPLLSPPCSSRTPPGPRPSTDVLLKGGHVIDPRNDVNRRMDVAVTAGKIARVAENIAASEAKKVVDVTGLYVTPGLVDIHVHVYTGPDPLAELHRRPQRRPG